MSAPIPPTSSTASSTPRASAPPRRLPIGEILTRLGPVAGLVFVFAIFAFLSPKYFLSLDNFTSVFYQTAVVATAALGMTIIIISGGIDLSVGSSIALCTVIVAQFLCYFSNGHFYASEYGKLAPPNAFMVLLAALCGIAVCALAGGLIGLLVTRLRLAPFIVSLGMWSSLRGIAKLLANESNVRSPRPTWLDYVLKSTDAMAIPENPTLLFHIRRIFWWIIDMPYGVWLTVLLSVLVALMLRYTRFGRYTYAIGSNEATARLCGVRVNLMKVLIYSLGAAFVGIAGVLEFSFVKMGDPTDANGKELDIIAAVVVGGASLSGGRGGVLGTIIGALIMTLVANGCAKAGISNSWQQVVTGAIIIMAVSLDYFRKKSR